MVISFLHISSCGVGHKGRVRVCRLPMIRDFVFSFHFSDLRIAK
jgi:hypothetical protein